MGSALLSEVLSMSSACIQLCGFLRVLLSPDLLQVRVQDPASVFPVTSAFAWPAIWSIVLLLALLIMVLLAIRGLIRVCLEGCWSTSEHELLLHMGKALNLRESEGLVGKGVCEVERFLPAVESRSKTIDKLRE